MSKTQVFGAVLIALFFFAATSFGCFLQSQKTYEYNPRIEFTKCYEKIENRSDTNAEEELIRKHCKEIVQGMKSE